MSPEVVSELVAASCKIIVAIVGAVISCVIIPWLNNTAVPYLKEKRAYSLCVKFVQAAEKLYESGELDTGARKKEFVEKMLSRAGIEVTPEISAMIESAVKDLDLAMGKIGEAFTEEDSVLDRCSTKTATM